MTGKGEIAPTATGIIVEVTLDITADHAPQSPDQLIHLSRVGTSDGICDTYTVHADLVYGAVDR